MHRRVKLGIYVEKPTARSVPAADGLGMTHFRRDTESAKPGSKGGIMN